MHVRPRPAAERRNRRVRADRGEEPDLRDCLARRAFSFLVTADRGALPPSRARQRFGDCLHAFLDRCRRFPRPDPRIPPHRAAAAATSVSSVFASTLRPGFLPLRSFPPGVSRCPETRVPGGTPPIISSRKPPRRLHGEACGQGRGHVALSIGSRSPAVSLSRASRSRWYRLNTPGALPAAGWRC